MQAIKSSALINSLLLSSSDYSLCCFGEVLRVLLLSKLIILEREAVESNPAYSILDFDRKSSVCAVTSCSLECFLVDGFFVDMGFVTSSCLREGSPSDIYSSSFCKSIIIAISFWVSVIELYFNTISSIISEG